MAPFRLAVPRRVRVPPGAAPWREPGSLRVVHVGQSAAILARPSQSAGRLLPLTSARRGLVPGGVCLPDDDEFAALAARLAAAQASAYRIPGAAAAVDLGHWRATPPAEISVVDLRVRPVHIPSRAVRELVTLVRGEQDEARDAGTVVIDPRPLRALAGPLTRAALDHDDGQVGGLLARLVGAGPGATPTGDDVVVGVLAALDTVAARPRARLARALLGRHLHGLLGRTTAASRHDLTAAIDGEFAEHVHGLIAALTRPAALPAAFARARTWGATSGVDLAGGLALALESITDRPARHHVPTSAPTQHRRSA